MVRAGYKVNIQPTDSNVSEDGSLTFTNVFMSLKDFINFTDSENFSDNSVIPKFTASFVTVKNLQELNAISTDLQSENSSLLSLGIDRIALQGNIAPTFSHIQQAGMSGLSFVRVNKTNDEYTVLSGSEGVITLKLAENEITSMSESAQDILASGVNRLNLFGKEIDVSLATTLVDSGFSFEGGKISTILEGRGKPKLWVVDSIFS